jgi:hypothetical protein
MLETLSTLRSAQEAAYASLLSLIARKHPKQTIWHWYRACSALRGENLRRNDDTTHDAAMAHDAEIHAAHVDYIEKLHAFYSLRDGPNGVLGGRL